MIDLIQVIKATKLIATNKPWVKEAIDKLVEFGVPKKEIQSKDTCFLYIQEEWPMLNLDALLYDWLRIYEVICFDKVTEAQVHR